MGLSFLLEAGRRVAYSCIYGGRGLGSGGSDKDLFLNVYFQWSGVLMKTIWWQSSEVQMCEG